MGEVRITQKVGSFDFNYDEIKAEAEKVAKAYAGVVVTEETIPESKKDKARLNKLRNEIDTARKEAKKEYMKPYTEFEERVKSILEIIDEPIKLIDGQLKDFEEKRIAEKQAHLLELWEESVGEYAEYIPFESVKKPQWDNKSYSDSEVKTDISEKVVSVKNDLTAIKALSSEIEDKLLEEYKQNGLAAAIKRNSDYLDAKRTVVQEPTLVAEPTPYEDMVEEAIVLSIRKEDADQALELLDFAEIGYTIVSDTRH